MDPFGAQIAAVWVAYDARGQAIHVYREYVQPFGVTTGAHVEQILKLAGYAANGAPTGSAERIFAWVGGGPSERQARTDFTGFGLPLVPSPVKEVWAGIDRIAGLMREGRLFIHDTCVNLLSEIGDYRRKLNTKTGEFTDAIENKDAYHCLVGETLVSTDRGEKELKEIRPGDMVLTRQGYRCVLAWSLTNLAARVYEVRFSDGSTITGTEEHPVWVEGKGHTDLHSLRYGDIILRKEEVSPWHHQKASGRQLRSMEEPGGDTLGQQAGVDITQPTSGFTSLCGHCIMDGRFQRDRLFITLMEMSQTTRLQTSNLLNTKNIVEITEKNAQNGLAQLSNQWEKKQRQNGIVPLKVAPGTKNTEGSLGNADRQRRGFVLTVGKSSRPEIGRRQHASALMPVGPMKDTTEGTTTKPESANGVAKNLSVTSITEPPIVPVHVLRVIGLPNKRPVYNLEVENAHEFFANGVLVHNCVDSLRYVLSWLTGSGEETEDTVIDRSVPIGPRY